MNIQTKFKTALTIRSFAYVARQLAHTQAALSPAAQYERILSEAEKHRSALRLMQRDLIEMTEQGLRDRTLTNTQSHQLRETATRAITQAQQTITRIAARYGPHKLAA